MLEADLRELFDRQASGEQPPFRVSTEQLLTDGRSRSRRRRVIAGGTSLLVAAATLAVALTGAHWAGRPAASPAHRDRPAKPAQQRPSAPRSFDPLVPYASFGWLPPGFSVSGISAARTVEFLAAVGPGQLSWQVAIFTAGDCNLAHAKLACRDLTSLLDPPVTSRAPDINGLPAYWGPSTLIFQYARGGWATVTFHSPANVLRMARHLIFGAATRAIRFPTQLSGVSSGWGVKDVMFSYRTDGPAAWSYNLARGAADLSAPYPDTDNIPSIMVQKASPDLRCYWTPGESTQTAIAGHQVTVTRIPADHGPAEQNLCAADADGLSVSVQITGNHPVMDVTEVFAHLTLFGPDPANWTTKPIA
jgi:hypothetical protein